eukprot:754762-Hanusia_phi.AAC.9
MRKRRKGAGGGRSSGTCLRRGEALKKNSTCGRIPSSSSSTSTSSSTCFLLTSLVSTRPSPADAKQTSRDALPPPELAVDPECLGDGKLLLRVPSPPPKSPHLLLLLLLLLPATTCKEPPECFSFAMSFSVGSPPTKASHPTPCSM